MWQIDCQHCFRRFVWINPSSNPLKNFVVALWIVFKQWLTIGERMFVRLGIDFLQSMQSGLGTLFHLARLEAVGSCCWSAFFTKRNKKSGSALTTLVHYSFPNFRTQSTITCIAWPWSIREWWDLACRINEDLRDFFASDNPSLEHSSESVAMFLADVSVQTWWISGQALFLRALRLTRDSIL